MIIQFHGVSRIIASCRYKKLVGLINPTSFNLILSIPIYLDAHIQFSFTK